MWDPADVTVGIGDTVRWTYDETAVLHTLHSGDPRWKTEGDRNRPAGSPPDEHAFTEPGDYRFFCAVHPAMQGKVVVEGADPTQTPTATPSPTASPTPSAISTPTPSPTPEPVPVPDATPPALRTLAAKVRRGSVRLRFKLGEDAKVTVVARRRGSGTTLRRTARLRSGTRTITLTLKRGRYTIAASARDAAGNTSPTIRRTVRVR